MREFFTFAFLTSLVVCATVGCGGSSSSSYTPSSSSSSSGSVYDSPEFQNASSDVQEDVIIYNTLRNMGYSDAESKNAVINTME